MGLSPFWQQPMQMPPIPFGQGAPSAPQAAQPMAPGPMGFAMPQLPDPQPMNLPGGMFGANGKLNIGAAIATALNGYLAGAPGSGQAAGLAGLKAMQDRQQMALEEQVYEHRQNLEMQRQMAMLPLQAQLKLMYPDNAFAQEAYQSGIQPGTPQWTQAMQTRVQNELDPAVVTPQGMMLRSQITGALKASAPPPPQPGEVQDGYRFKGGNPADPNAWEAIGGPTPQASGNFR